MEKLTLEGLTIEPRITEANGPVSLRWRGRSQDRYPGKVLGPYLAEALGRASESSSGLEMLFGELEYFNSATVMAIIQCIHAARSKGVRLTLVYDDALEWQRLSFIPMHVFTKDGHVELRTERGNGARAGAA